MIDQKLCRHFQTPIFYILDELVSLGTNLSVRNLTAGVKIFSVAIFKSMLLYFQIVKFSFTLYKFMNEMDFGENLKER